MTTQELSREPVAGAVAPPPLIYALGLASGFALQALVGAASIPAGARWPLGGALLVGGLALLNAFAAALRRARTTLNPWRPSSAIVTTGPYRRTRNPGYLAMAMLSAAIALLAGALWPLATLAAAVLVVDRGVIRREEAYLSARFGAEYDAYRRRVRRWL